MSLLTAYWKAANAGTTNFQSGLTLADFQVTIIQLTKASPPVETRVVNAAAAQFELTYAVGTYGYVYSSANFSLYDYIVDVKYVGATPLDCILWTEKKDSGNTISGTITVSGDLIDKIRNQIQESVADLFTSDEIAIAATDALREYSKYDPLRVNTTLVTTANSRMIDISSLDELLLEGYKSGSFFQIEEGKSSFEYPISQWERKFRNFSIYSNGYAELNVDSAPSSAGETVNVIYYGIHSSDTLPPINEGLVAKRAAAKAAKVKPLKFLNEWNSLTTKYDAMTTAINNMAGRVTQITNDLSSGRELIEQNYTEIMEAIGDMAAKITLMSSDIASARTYFNKANIGQPESEYLNSASLEAQTANTSLNKARGYLSAEGSTPSEYRGMAAGELALTNIYLNQLRGYVEHLKLKMATVNLADKYEAWGARLEASTQRELEACDTRGSAYQRWATG